jgi:predicted dehydrogenase
MKTRIAVAGGGALSRIFYLPVLKKNDLQPSILIDPDKKSADELCREYSIPKNSGSLDQCMDDLDAAIIATPNFLHAPQAKLLLENHKHVLLEKPIAASEREVQELVDISGKNRLVLQPAMMRRFWKINKAVKKMLQDEVLGTLQSITMQEGGVLDWPVQSAAIFNPEFSQGGVFIDTGSHTLDLLCWWTDCVDFSLRYQDDNRGGVEADCRLEMELNKGSVNALVELSRIRKMANEFTIKGSRGWITLKPYGNLFESSGRAIDKYIYQQYSAIELKEQKFEDLFSEQVQSWLKSIETGAEPVITAQSVLPSIRMIEQAYQHRHPLVHDWN